MMVKDGSRVTRDTVRYDGHYLAHPLHKLLQPKLLPEYVLRPCAPSRV